MPNELPGPIFPLIKWLHLVLEIPDLLLFDHHEWLILLMNLLRFSDLLSASFLLELVSVCFHGLGVFGFSELFETIGLALGEGFQHVGVDKAVRVLGVALVKLVTVVFFG